MRLAWYWLGFVALFLYLMTLDSSNSLYSIFVFALTFFFALLVLLTVRWLARSGWRSFVEWIRFSKSERVMRKRDETTESPLELRLAHALDEKSISYVREYRISNIHVDFAFPSKKLAVECDGFRYHSSSDARKRDAKRDDFLRSKGWTVLRFSGNRIRSDIDGCIDDILDNL